MAVEVYSCQAFSSFFLHVYTTFCRLHVHYEDTVVRRMVDTCHVQVTGRTHTRFVVQRSMTRVLKWERRLVSVNTRQVPTVFSALVTVNKHPVQLYVWLTLVQYKQSFWLLSFRSPSLPLDLFARNVFKLVISASSVQMLLAQKDSNHISIHKKRRCFLWNNQYFQLDIYQEPCLPK